MAHGFASRLVGLAVSTLALACVAHAQSVVYATVDPPPTGSTPLTLSEADAYNASRPVTVSRTEAGRYIVRFQGLPWTLNPTVAGSAGHFQVSGRRIAGTSAMASCAIDHWERFASGVQVVVRCVRASVGFGVDAGFSVIGMEVVGTTNGGYVWLDTPAPTGTPHIPPAGYAYAPGGAPTITRTALATYAAGFPGLPPANALDGGHAMVSAYDVSGRRCRVQSWTGTPIVTIGCTSAQGTPQNAQFTAAFIRRGFLASGEFYLWADQPASAGYAPDPSYAHNTLGTTIWVSRSSVGSYEVQVPGGASANGHLGGFHVAAYNDDAVCGMQSVTADTATGLLTIGVTCEAATGAAINSRFLLARLTNVFQLVSDEPGAQVVRLTLLAPSPNPVAGVARLPIVLPAASEARVAVYDTRGREVAVLHDGPLAAGQTALTLDATRLTPGVYVARAVVGREIATQRFVVVR